jgi:cytochrome c551/c552
MKKPFGAQFADDDITAMVDYLSKTYGAGRAVGSGATATQVLLSVRKAEAVAVVAPSNAPANALALIKSNNCTACHAVDARIVGPSFKEVILKYAGKEDAVSQIAHHIRVGGAGKWRPVPMPPSGQPSEAEASALARYVLSQ